MTMNLLSIGLIVAQAAIASPVATVSTGLYAPDGTMIGRAAVDCSGAATQVVRQIGGQLLSASAKSSGGQVVCEITVLVPGNGYDRPKKITEKVPQ